MKAGVKNFPNLVENLNVVAVPCLFILGACSRASTASSVNACEVGGILVKFFGGSRDRYRELQVRKYCVHVFFLKQQNAFLNIFFQLLFSRSPGKVC